ncbi:flagellar hook protein FlgE [Mesoterricola sediminis]|uniref:Flagellar hook protein FlgE n=1 Tax=Mesoterricola sediminis TaxID=2927980 RepID=A0AA48HFX5_9BACT|nr:flagellar hook protein FlgE [Mesoterricola sediminis]BDU77493.1 flagellar hook protein FlgE [Mesoterricola sediminis]
MGLYSSFYASLSGLSTNASALSVIGNNLANLNTAGFKGASSEFQDLFAAAIANQGTQGNGNPMQVGLGASLGSVATNFSQGSFQQTGNVTDMAMQGNGFFTLQNKQGSAVYTRNGNFTIDKSGFLVDSQGNKVMGWNATNGVVNPGGLPTPIQLNMAGTSGGVATRNVEIIANLNSAAATTSVFTSTVQIYDSLGATHSVTLSFQPTGTAGQWAVTGPATVDGAAVAGIPAYLQFDNTGALTGYIPAGGLATDTPTTITGNNNPSISFTGFANGAADASVKWELATPNTTGSGFTAYFTSYASASTTSATSQDGYGAGTVDSLTVDQNGVIIGNYTNGQTIPMGQVAVSTFLNENGLSKVGGNNWIATVASGTAAVGAANQGGRGGVLGSNLELSNVDVATELTRMIVNQNGYQANSRVVTTANTLLQEVLNLVR